MKVFQENKRYTEDDIKQSFTDSELQSLLKENVFKFEDDKYKAVFVGTFFTRSSFCIFYPKYVKEFNNFSFDLLHDVLMKYASDDESQSAVKKKVVHHFSLEGEANNELYEFYVLLKDDYKSNGLLVDTDTKEYIKKSGRVNWNRTLKKIKPIITEEGAIYDRYCVSKKLVDLSIITKIHASVLIYLEELFSGRDEIPEIKNLALNDLFEAQHLQLLVNELRSRNYDRDIYVLKMLISVLDGLSTFKGAESVFSIYGTSSFWAVWEGLCRSSFDDKYENYKEEIPETIFESAEGTLSKLGRQRPDIICSTDGGVIIMDAKYYNNPKKIPLGDIVKQFQYQESFNLNNIKGNYLILPKDIDSQDMEFLGKIYFKHADNEGEGYVSCVALNPSIASKVYLREKTSRQVQDRIREEAFSI